MIVNSDNLIFRAAKQQQVATFVCRKGANLHGADQGARHAGHRSLALS
jgi:hypothetical protein